MKRLYKSSTNKKWMGVCGGLGDYFGIDPLIFRLIFLMLVFVYNTGFILYIVLGLLLPYDYEVDRREQRETKRPTFMTSEDKVYRWGGMSDESDRKDVTPSSKPNKDDWSNF